MKSSGTDFDILIATLHAHPEGISIQEVAGLMGIHRNTAAKYLEILQSRGEVDVRRVGVSKLFIPGKRVPYSCVRRLFDEPVIGVDRDLVIVDLNDRAASLLGKSKKDLIGSPIWNGESSLGAGLSEHIREVLKGQWLTWENGRKPPVFLIRGIPVKYSDNRTGAAVVIVDQNQFEGLKAEFNHVSGLLSLITTYQSEYVIRLNLDLTYAWVNTAYAELFGLTPDAMAGTRFSLRVSEEEMALLLHTIQQSTIQGDEIVYRVLLPSGDIRYHQAVFRPIAGDDGNHGGYIGISKDITDIRLREEQFKRLYTGTEELLAERTQELRELNRQMYREIAEREQVETTLRSIEFAVQHVTDMIIWFDPVGIITYANHSAREILLGGSSAKDIPISGIIRRSPSGDWESFWNVLREYKTIFHESVLLLPDNRTIPAEIVFNFMDYGNKEYCCCVARDIHERKLAMAELIESENRFRQLAGIIPEIFYLFDIRADALLYINPAFELIFGISLNQIYRDPYSWREQIYPEDRDRMLSMLSDSTKKTREIEGRIIRPDGEIRWIEARVFSITDDEGQPYREVGVIADITNRKKIEEELRLTSDRFMTTIKAAPVSIFNQDASLRYTWIGQSSPGFTSADLLGKTDYEIYPPEVAERLGTVKRTALQSGKSVRADLNIGDGDRERSVRIFVEPFHDLNGTIAGITVAAIDLTDIFRTREALRISEDKFRRFFDETNDVCLVFRIIFDDMGEPVDYVFDDLNRQTLALIGKTKPEIIGRPLSAFPSYFDSRWLPSLHNVATNGVPVVLEGFSEHYLRHFSVHVYPVGGEQIGVIARDISHLVRSYEQVEHQRDLALILGSTVNLQEALHQILEAGIRVPGIDSGGIYFTDDNTVLHLQAHIGLQPEFINKVSTIEITPAVEEAYRAGTPIYYSPGLPSPTRTPESTLNLEELTTYVSLPILNNGKLFAILNLGSHTLDEIPAIERPYLEALPAHLGETLARVRYGTGFSGIADRSENDTQIQILDSDCRILEGSALFDEAGYAPESVRSMISGGKELLFTGQEVTGEVSLTAGHGHTYRIRVRFIPWGREVAYLVIWKRSSGA